MTQLFRRKCVAIVAPPINFVEVNQSQAVVIEGLRCVFRVDRDLEKNANKLELSVYNLSETTRARLQRKADKIYLQAGYHNTVKQVFSGDIRQVDQTREGPDWVTKFYAGDGERALRFARFSNTYRPGTTVREVVRAIADALGVDSSAAISQAESLLVGGLDQFVTGYAFHGKASTALDEVLDSVSLTWSIQDGTLQILRRDQPLQGQVVVISPESGLIGSPTFGSPDEKDGPPILQVKSLLQPSIRCGGQVEVRSERIKGQFKVIKLSHTGDTHGGDFYTDLECVAL